MSEKKTVILGKWIESAFSVFPEQSRSFFKGSKTEFDNPLGSAVKQGLEEVLDVVLSGKDLGDADQGLDKIAKVFAIQDMPASLSMRFVLELRNIMIECLDGEDLEESQLKELGRVMDDLVLRAFDAYTICRQRIFELRVNDVKRSVSGVLRELHKRGFLEDPDEPVKEDGPAVCAARLSRGDDR